jgi:cell division protein FtsQ
MTTSRRPRRSQTRNTGDAKITTSTASAASSAGETARTRRERRSRGASVLAFGTRLRKSSPRFKPMMYDTTAPRTKVPRTRTVRSPLFRTLGTPPPVFVRGGMAHLPVQPRKLGASPKRRYNVALNVPGAELHLPAVPVLHLSWRTASGIMTALLLALAVYLWTSSKYRIEMVQVNGLQRLTENDINTVLNLSGQSIFSANPQKIKQDLRGAFPDIKSVSVKVSLPANVTVAALERTPVIAWSQGGNVQWIDMEGLAFPSRGLAGELIVVEAKNSPPAIDKTSPLDLRFISPEMVDVIGRMAKNAPKDTSLLYDSEHGLGWMDPLGYQVYFGMDIRDMDEKLVVYQALVTRLQKDGIQPQLISMEFLHAPYYRLEP